MYSQPLYSCCGILELSDLKESHVYLNYWNPTKEQIARKKDEDRVLSGEDLDGLVSKIEKQRDVKNSRRFYQVVVATTPDKEEWWMFHIALAMAGFLPVAKGRTQHKGKYDNILWVFERDSDD